MTRSDQAAARARMVDEQLRQRGIHDERVLAAMAKVPRELFVPSARRSEAYADCALPLSHDQTISQPYMVARALELAQIGAEDTVLEVGLGSGYQAAVIAQLCKRVVAIELIPELAERARESLRDAGIGNVEVRVGDGSKGVPECAPFDAILVAAFATDTPPALLAQLSLHGRLVIPIGTPSLQMLTVITRGDSGYHSERHDACVYVPLRERND